MNLSHSLQILIEGKDKLTPSVDRITSALERLKTISKADVGASKFRSLSNDYWKLKDQLDSVNKRVGDFGKNSVKAADDTKKSITGLQSAVDTLFGTKDTLTPQLEKMQRAVDQLRSKNIAETDYKGIAANERAIENMFLKMETATEDFKAKASRMWDNPLEATKAFESKITGTLSLLVWAFENTFLVKAAGSIIKFIKHLSEIPKKLVEITTQLSIMGVAVGTAFAAFSLGMAKSAEIGEYAMDVFESIAGDSAPELLTALRENSRFMISDTQLLETYNKAYMLVGDTIARRMPEAYNSLSRVATAYGEDADYLMERLYTSVGRLSTRWMAYIGTVVTVEEAEAEAAKMFNKTADALTYNEKQAGMMELTLERLADRAQDFPEVLGTTVQMSKALSASIINLSSMYGEIFTPALRSGTQAALDWLKVIQALISEGGGLYKFLRTMSATMAVLFDYLSALAGKFFDFEDNINASIERLADNLMATAWRAFSWGFNIAAQIGIGLIEGAAKWISVAAGFITTLLTNWFAPGSPPKVAPNIDKWGALTMNEYLKGFEAADFDILEGTQNKLESVLQAMVSAGWMVKQDAAEIFLSVSADMVKALTQLQDTGEVVDSMFSGLLQLEGPYGEALVKLTQLQIGYSEAVMRVTNATEALKAAEDELVASQDNLSKETDEYYMLLLTKASYVELVAGKAEKKAAQERNKYAKVNLKNAEEEKTAAEKNLEGLEDRLALQGKLIDQLALLLTKQAEMLPDEEKTKAEKTPKELAGGGAFELPELVLAGGIPKIDIDQAFEDLKARIKAKFDELWQGVVDEWNSSGAGKAVADMLDALSGLDNWLTVRIPVYLFEWKQDIVGTFNEVTGTIRDWWNVNVHPLLEKFDTWLMVTVPVMLFEWKQNFPTTFGEVFTIIKDWWYINVEPVLDEFKMKLEVTLYNALNTFLKRSGEVYPGVSQAVLTMAGVVFPIFLTFAKFLGIDIPKAGKTFDKKSQEHFSSLYTFLSEWWVDDVLPLLEEFISWFLPLGMLKDIEEFVILFNQKFSPVVQLLDAAWLAAQTLLEKLKKLLRWIIENPIGINIGFGVPEPLENDSPIRFHTRLMDMDKWIKENPMDVNVGLKDSSGITSGNITPVTGGNTFYIDNLILEGVQDKEGLLRQLEEAI